MISAWYRMNSDWIGKLISELAKTSAFGATSPFGRSLS
jgi:hypothetical protein